MSEGHCTKQLLPLLAIVILLFGAFFAASIVSPVYASTPTVSPLATVGITVNTTSIDWGVLYPGWSVLKAVNVTNVGDSNATLYLSTSTWTPWGADSYLNLTWDYNNETVVSLQSLIVNLTLNVSGSAPETSFSFNIIISIFPIPITPIAVYVVPVALVMVGTTVTVAWLWRRSKKSRIETVRICLSAVETV